ncbi:MAG: hypothetical protein B6D45_07430 [Ignavibacteriales bacterium UTCHB3]|nr:MAG: hypothetical protein B6D45_07430 [Ignavibacteriales bacterium UTCHB3]
MRKTDKNFEDLSALIDDELREDQADICRDKLQRSPGMREKLTELKKIKTVVSELSPLPEDRYFCTRLEERIKQQGKNRYLQKPYYKPVASLATVTFVLLFFFSFNPGFLGDLFENQKENLLEFYTKNLRPYFLEEELSKEDVFNFAFTHELPIDSVSGSVLSLGGSGSDLSIAIKQGSVNNSMTLNRFIEKLNLNPEQRAKLDKVLTKYEEKIRKSILINDNNTVAVNTNIRNYIPALKAEILSIAAENKSVAGLLPAGFMESIPSLASMNFAEDEGAFVCINPDTVFVFSMKLDPKSVGFNTPVVNKQEILKNAQVVLSSDKTKYGGYHVGAGDTSKGKKFRIRTDNNLLKFDLPELASLGGGLPFFEMKRLDSLVDQSMKIFEPFFKVDSFPGGAQFKFEFPFNAPGIPNAGKGFGFKFDTSKGGGTLEFMLPGPDSANFKIILPDGKNGLPDFKGFGGLDSLLKFKDYGNEPGNPFNFPFKDFNGGDLEKLREEMEKFKEDFNKFKEQFKDFKGEPKKTTPKPIEI